MHPRLKRHNDKTTKRQRKRAAQRGPASAAFVASCLVLLCIDGAFAQAVSLAPSERAAWDVSGTLGWFSGNKSGVAEEWNDWYDTFAASVDVGRYWTPHLKTEAGATFTTAGTVYSHVEVPLPSQPFPIFIQREHHFRLNAVNLAAAYQFLDNQWVHPFAQAGVQLGWEHEERLAPEFLGRGVDPRNPIPAPLVTREEGSTFGVRPFAGVGAKFYVSERGFVRSDVTLGWNRHGIAHAHWRAGFGIDF
jgi:hypothetical protein